MKIIVSGQHLIQFPELEQYAVKKVEKFPKYHTKIEKVRVHLISKQSHRDKTQDFYCEIQVDIPGNNLELVDVEESMDKAIDKAVERMKRLLIKTKEKSISKKHKEGLKIRDKT